MGVYYINLSHRKDRKKHIEHELMQIFPIIHRIDAVHEPKNGALGCAQSHINALKIALHHQNQDDEAFIFEDDFQWELPINEVRTILQHISIQSYNIALLSYHLPLVKCSYLRNHLGVISNAQTTAGYVIKREFIPRLIECFESSVAMLIKGMHPSGCAIDQQWKILQKPKYNFFGIMPRLGRQMTDISDIEGKVVDYQGGCFMAIMSCQSRVNNKKHFDSNKTPFPFRYFVGDPTLTNAKEDGDVIILPCEDTYEALSSKTYEIVKWVHANYPNIDYLFKTDEDITIDVLQLYSVFQECLLKKIRYGGKTATISYDQSTYHFGKCTDKKINITPVQMKQNTTYCAGGGYFLHKSCMKLLLQHMKKYMNIFEDYSVGLTLTTYGIKPMSLDIKHACSW